MAAEGQVSHVSRRELWSNVIDLRDESKLQWIKVVDDKSLTAIIKRFAKRGWFFVYRQRYEEHYLIFASSIDLEKDLPAKSKWEKQ